MKLETVQANLRNTIAGKVKHQVELEYALTLATTGERMALIATLEYLKVNIDELKRILTDVELCMNDAAANSWAGEVDRQGGSFTDEEIARANEWR